MTQFVPHQEEEKLPYEITAKELFVIEELRKIHFGKVMIQKMDGVLVRIEPQISIIIK